MEESVGIIIQVMLKLFLIMALGFLLTKVGIIDKNTNSKLSALISKVTAPLLVLSSVLSSSKDNRMSVLVVLALGFLMYLGFILFGKLISNILGFPKEHRKIYECMLVFSNNAFMGYPVIQSLLGTEAIFYTAMLHFSFNILIFSYGISCISSIGNTNGEKEKFDIKKLANPSFLLMIFALIVYIIGFRDNSVIYETAYMVGNVTSPLSMIVLGASLGMYPLKESISDPRSYVFSVVRLLVLPVVTLCICRLLNVNEMYTTIATITNGMPVASLVLMIGNQYNIDTRVIIRNIVVTTVLSTFTVPVIVAMLNYF